MSGTGGMEAEGRDGGVGGGVFRDILGHSEIFCRYFCSLPVLGAKSVELCYCVA